MKTSTTCSRGNLLMILSLTLDVNRATGLFRIFQKGFDVHAKTGCSIRSFLSDQLAVDPGYVSERILVVFLDGRPVDDLDRTFIRTGSSLSLSAAVPGLVGAAVKSGSTYASLRSSITHRETGNVCFGRESTVQLKLFNLVAKELGPALLERGILIDGSELVDILTGWSDNVWRECGDILLNGKPVDSLLLQRGSWASRDSVNRDRVKCLFTVRPKRAL